MRIREYTPADFDALRRMHAAQGFGYPLPDLDSPLFVTKLVLEDEDSSARFSLRGLAEAREATGSKALVGGREAPGGREVADRNSLREESPSREEVPWQSNTPRVNGSRRIVMAVLLRLTAETYLLQDPAAGTPRQRWQRFLALHEAALRAAADRGLDDAQAFLPPRIARSFGRRLARLGWTQDPWPCFSRRLP